MGFSLDKKSHEHPDCPQTYQQAPVDIQLEKEGGQKTQCDVDKRQMLKRNVYVLCDERDMRIQLAIRKGLSAAHKDDKDKAVDRRVRISHSCGLKTHWLSQIERYDTSCNSKEACN